MTSPYVWYSHKKVVAARARIAHNKAMLKYLKIEFKIRWRNHNVYPKQVLYTLIDEMRGYKVVIDNLYKSIPIPLYIVQDSYQYKGNLHFVTYWHCPKCYEELNNTNYIHCPWCGQALWRNDQLNDTLDRYENGIYDGVHRRLK